MRVNVGRMQLVRVLIADLGSVTTFLFLTSHNIFYFQLQFVLSVSYSVLILFIIVDLDSFYFCIKIPYIVER